MAKRLVQSPSNTGAAPYGTVRQRVEAAMVQAAAEARTEVLDHELPYPPKGTKISLNAVRTKYGIGLQTVSRWANEYRWVQILEGGEGQGRPTYVDEYDVVDILRNPKNHPGPQAG